MRDLKIVRPGRTFASLAPRLITDTSMLAMAMLQGDRTYTPDANNILADNAAALTATGFAQAGGADGVVDLGGNQGVTVTLPSIADVSSITPQQARIDAVLVVDVTAIDIASGNEVYNLILEGSNDPAWPAGSGQVLAAMQLGKGASRAGSVLKDSVIGRYELLFTNEQANVKYQYAKLYVVAGGTTPSIAFFAFIAVLGEP